MKVFNKMRRPKHYTLTRGFENKKEYNLFKFRKEFGVKEYEIEKNGITGTCNFAVKKGSRAEKTIDKIFNMFSLNEGS